ncbi:DUF4097 family beta strand repeat-containing protein [Antrihabitans cavernicola]|uniref:DUF4097 domain-containing protein n=1 Tax=Antrihabitans cavernicola TaxID=2495913 RepID=A0A5A7SF35_9NOCA|nr:DUF4097 family beta strand repeat-containing protein [Spelaeibacter cavernicola]KAA0024718.1 DUF4097 domain-containing protein [Spelaeibacter cavernicola]
MQTYDTPNPIAVIIDVMVADVTIDASDRTDSMVTVTPSNPSKPADVKAAEQCKVGFADGRLTVKSLKQWKMYSPFGPTGSIDVLVEVPTGSQVSGDSSLGTFRSEGRLGDCIIKTSMGGIHLDQTAKLNADSSSGDITVNRVIGRTEASTGNGAITFRDIDGTAAIKNSNGETRVDVVTGDIRVNSANGAVTIGSAHASVDAKTANGNIRVAEVVEGAVVLETALGELEIGVREGTAAWLDAHTQFGRVDSTLDESGSPAAGKVVEVRARTSMGDIIVHRSSVAYRS